MFFRKVTSRTKGKEYNYLKLIENYREGNKVKQRVIANLGNLDDLTPEKVQLLISGLSRICGLSQGSTQLEAKKVLRYGEALAIHKIWELLGIPAAIEKAVPYDKANLNLSLITELITINQIIKPQNKQAINDWMQLLSQPDLEEENLNLHHFYSTLDIIDEVKYQIERNIFSNLTRLFPINTELVFCRLLSGTFEPAPRDEFNSSTYGRYFLEGPDELMRAEFCIMISRNGFPFGHWLCQNASGGWQFKDIQAYISNTYGADKCIFVGDRNLMTNTSLELLVAHGHEYIVGRRFRPNQNQSLYREYIYGKDAFKELNEGLRFKEVSDGNVRQILCIDSQSAKYKTDALEEQITNVEQKLKAIQKATEESHHKSNGFAFNKNDDIFKNNYCRMYFEWRYDEVKKEFNYRRMDEQIEQEKLQHAGIFLLETNTNILSDREILETYINTAHIGDSMHTISSFETRPLKFNLNKNISASIFICLLASILEKTMEKMLYQAGINLHPRQALELLEEIKLSINQLDNQEVKSITRIPKTQKEILRAIGVHSIEHLIV